MGKAPIQPQGGYTAVPDRDDAASTSSAVPMGEMGYPEEELPAYTDESYVVAPSTSQSRAATTDSVTAWYTPPSSLPFSTHDSDCTEVRTRFPDYSTNAETLLDMIREQARYPPTYIVQLSGTHTETTRDGKKDNQSTVQDFLFKINISYLLASQIGSGGYLELLPANTRGYRGTRLPALKPEFGDSDLEDGTEELEHWCEAFVKNPAAVKSFILKRKIINHDTKKLEQLLRSAIAETNYQGHLAISFHTTHKRVIVYSPGWINEWRITNWVRWVFYLTFLWIFSWPILFFLTHKYEVLKVVFPYANVPIEEGGDRRCTVQSEIDCFYHWESAIKRAALARMNCPDRPLDEDYRKATARAEARAVTQNLATWEGPITGNAVTDGALGFLTEGLSVAQDWHASRGWGNDS